MISNLLVNKPGSFSIFCFDTLIINDSLENQPQETSIPQTSSDPSTMLTAMVGAERFSNEVGQQYLLMTSNWTEWCFIWSDAHRFVNCRGIPLQIRFIGWVGK